MVARLWLVVAGVVVTGLLVNRLLLWIRSGLIRRLLVVAVAGALIDGLHSGWIGIAHGAIAVGALLLLLKLEFHLEQFDFLLLPEEG